MLVLLGAGCASAPPDGGPIPLRNQHPVQLTVQHLDPVRAETVPAGEARLRSTLAYSSMFLASSSLGSSFTMDGELLRAAVRATVGLGDRFDLTLELPVLYGSGGFLDGFLVGYHDALQLPDQGRTGVPRDRFQVSALYQGQEIYHLQDNEPLLGDVPISVGWSVTSPQGDCPGLLLRAGLELPTGDPERGSGNGQLDAALGVASSWPLSFGSLHGFAQHSFAGTPPAARRLGLDYRDVSSAGLAVEFGLTDDLSALVQSEWETSTLAQLGLGSATGDQWLLWLGGRLLLRPDLHLEVAIGEDLQGFASSDVTFWLSMAWSPRPRGPDDNPGR